MMGDSFGPGIDVFDSDPNFNFLSKIQNDSNSDDDFIFNSDFSPYSEININCSYAEPNHLTHLNNTNLSVLSLNIQSLSAKFLTFKDMLNDLSSSNVIPDIICLQEVWQIPDPSLFCIPNYQPILFNLRASAKGGGVGIYVRDGIKFSHLPECSIFVERIFESIYIEVSTEDNKKIIIGSVYRPGTGCPGITFTEQFSRFSDTLFNTLSELSSSSDKVFIYGDLNLDVLKLGENKFINDYIDTLFSFGFLQIITKPTRVAEKSATLIDHILTNANCENFDSYILCYQISDHFPILHYLNLAKKKQKQQKISVRNFSQTNIDRFKIALSNFNWKHVTDEINCTQSAYTNFSNTFNGLIDTFFPLTLKSFNCNLHKIEPWMSTGILTSRRRKNYLYSLYLKKPSFLTRDTFTKFRNTYNTVIRTAKKLYFQTQIEANSKNLRKTWQILFNAIRKSKNKKDGCLSLLINGNSISNPLVMADSFNKFFASAAVDVVRTINPSEKSPTENIAYNNSLFSLSSTPVTIIEILETTKLLADKKTPDFNGISSNF